MEYEDNKKTREETKEGGREEGGGSYSESPPYK